MERVSLTALYAKGAVALRHNRIKNTGGIDLVSTSYLISAYYNRSRLNFFEILRFISIFYSIAVSSLVVPSYAYRSSADNFCSKSVRPGCRA